MGRRSETTVGGARSTLHLVRCGALLCLLALFALLAFGARRLSFTIDEPAHLASGYAFLARGVEGLWTLPLRGHPVLVNAWAALPVLIGQPDVPLESLSGWGESHVTFITDWLSHLGRLERVEVAGRTPVMLLTVLLAAVVFRWTKDLWGERAGLLALGVLLFDPTLLAHGRLATNDVGVATFGTLALYVAWRWWRTAGWGWAVGAGALLAATMLSKASGVVWLAAVGLGTVLLGLKERRRGRFWLQTALVAGLALSLLWAGYGFAVGEVPGLSFPVPAPLHWQALLKPVYSSAQRPTFALGSYRQGNVWWYFPLAFLLKNPLPFLIALGSALLCLLRRPPHLLRCLALGLFPALHVLVALAWGPNIGYRHMLPLHPFFYLIIAGGLSQWVWTGRRWQRWLMVGLALWQIGGTLGVFPWEVAYFNEVAGGADGGWRYLADSNTDWGQAYKDLARFQRDQELGPVRLSAFVFYDPGAYGVEYEPLTPMLGDTPPVFPSRFNPPPGDYVISATTLDGIPLVDPEMYDWFRRREPSARIGHVLFYYRVTRPEPAPGWLAQCTVPVAPLSPGIAAEGLGRDGLRLLYFDCTRAWVYPDGGRSPGWYALFRGGETEGDFTRAHQALARLVYEQRLRRAVPPFALYEWVPAGPDPWPGGMQAGPVVAAPSAWTPDEAAQAGVRVAPPLALAGPLTFEGYRLAVDMARPGEELIVWTYWTVTDIPERALSLMAHLLAEDGQPLAVGDGLGVSRGNWRLGDTIVQRHALEVPPGTPPGSYWVHVGAYTLSDLQRLAVVSAEQIGADRILLAELEVVD
jgi:hypothetical protein